MTGATAARRWTCEGCGVAVGRMDGESVPLPESWDSSADGDFCLTCRRARAGEAALNAIPEGSTIEERARARRTGLVEFEVQRSPDLTDGRIAKACRTSASTVAAARKAIERR
ncbi:MAG TPA: hypothetical protein VMS60_12345 [Solirubrobacterales bacterium]|nr:hypothetical protein [Solirubrobacterales bacterium]